MLMYINASPIETWPMTPTHNEAPLSETQTETKYIHQQRFFHSLPSPRFDAEIIQDRSSSRRVVQDATEPPPSTRGPAIEIISL